MAGSINSPMEADGLLAKHVQEHRMARAALEMGLWGLSATLQGLPLARLLARESAVTREGQLRAEVETGIALGLQASPSALASRARAVLAEGYRRIKIKITPEDALPNIAAVRTALGADGPLSADANGSFSLDDAEHRQILEALDRFGLAMLEQPLPAADRWRGGILQHRMATPICLDEGILSVKNVEDMLEIGSARIVNLKPGRVAGFWQSLAIHDFCVRKSVPVWCGGMLECGIGRAYNVALASLPGFSEPGELSPSARYWARDVVTPAWTMDAQGMVKVPLDEPGLGVKVDVDFIDDCTVRTAVVQAS
jgi:O-succinylbenzoate synthase